jgi:hypothetical protein
MVNDLQFGLFFSYSEEDKGLAWYVKDVLDRTKIKTYIFEAYQKPGEPLVDAVTNAMKNSAYVAVALTKNSINSQWVNQEIGMAHGLGKVIIPIVDKDLDKNAYKGLIEFRTRLLLHPDDHATMIYLLLKRLRELLNRCGQEKDRLIIKCIYCYHEFNTILPSCEDIDYHIQKGDSLRCSCPHCGHDDVYVNPFTFNEIGV